MQLLARVLGENFVQHTLGLQDLFGLNLNVGGLSGDAAVGLVDHHFGMGQDVAFARIARSQQDRRAGIGSTDAVGGHFGRDEPHGVIDGQRVVDRATKAVDVEVDGLALFLVFQIEHLHHDSSGRGVIDLTGEEDHSVLEQDLINGHFAGTAVVHGSLGLHEGNWGHLGFEFHGGSFDPHIGPSWTRLKLKLNRDWRFDVGVRIVALELKIILCEVLKVGDFGVEVHGGQRAGRS